MASVHHGVRRDACLVSFGALPKIPCRNKPNGLLSAPGAGKAVRPTNFREIFPASLVGRKLPLKIENCARKIHWLTFTPFMSSPFFDYFGEVRRFRKTTSQREAELLIETGWKLLAVGIKRDPQDRGAFEDEFIYLLGNATEEEEN